MEAKFFKPEEFGCRCCGKHVMDEKAVEKIDRLRMLLGTPVYLASAYRCEDHNRKVGGAKNSFHLKGKAFDIPYGSSVGFSLDELYEAARMAGFTGFGFYGRFLHVDTGPSRMWVG